ncbi:MAG: Nramp family divalent metal transporter [Lentimicrobium sp.]|jgi:Mn2+/Fe2+ NRAMP family transporter|nr:Nramp family divalent metal transporter [Lentimicrobium sp.]
MLRAIRFLRTLGPGLLFAGAAVGVSHLVQSTRAGASYGFELVWVLIIANALKYPFMEFAPRYANSTGQSLVEGYARIGKFALILYVVLTVASMFAIQAAVSVVTAGLFASIFNIHLPMQVITAFILVLVMVVLILGRYKTLDIIIKWVIIALALSTFLAVIYAFGAGFFNKASLSGNFSWTKHADILFLIAFVGWMPAPIDVSVWHSLWSLAKEDQLGKRPPMKQVLLDFNIGYIGAALLGIGFLSLGALIMFGSGEQLSSAGLVFSEQLIHLYTKSIGNWAYPVIAIAALTTMFSTTITCLDAYPRVLSRSTVLLFPKAKQIKNYSKKLYWFWGLLVVVGTLLLLGYLSGTMGFMVDLATTISFVTAPVLAILNFRVITHKHVPAEAKPEKWLIIYAWLGIVFLSAFSLFYIFWEYALPLFKN